MALIDKESVINKICDERCMRKFSQCPYFEPCEAIRIIQAVPADAKPVVHGEWIYDTPEHEFRIDGRNKFRCSNCGEVTDDTCMGRPRANFCQICGADMREENDET